MSDLEMLKQEAASFREAYTAAQAEIGKAIVGQERVIDACLTALIAGGNVLLEGVPGLGKTMLVKAMSEVLRLDFKRVQFTPDLMPADIIGTNILNTDPATGAAHFEFRKGPLFTQLLLADEINRATPKTQSALLETMQEGSVTAGGQTWKLPPPFFVMATQNPIEQEGTYPLPEAQLDRFMFKVQVPFVTREQLNTIVLQTILRPATALEAVLDAAGILRLREILDKVVVAPPVLDFAIRLVMATHPAAAEATDEAKKFVRWGASPRAAQALIKAGRVRALVEGRAHVAADDIRYFAPEVLTHRVLLNYDGQAEGISAAQVVEKILAGVPESV